MSESNTNVTVDGLTETVRLYGTLEQIALQLVGEYNMSNGWSLVRTLPTPIYHQVYLERSVKQAKAVEQKAVKKEPTPKKVQNKAKAEVVGVDDKQE